MSLASNLDISRKIEPNNKRKINGACLVKRNTYSDDRGHLTEIYRIDEEYHKRFNDSISQVYLVENEERGIIRGFHKHLSTRYSFFAAHGSAKFVLVDDRPESDSYGVMNEFILSRLNKALLIVPSGVFNGWMSLTRDTLIVGMTSIPYNRDNPDDARIPPTSFEYNWEVVGR